MFGTGNFVLFKNLVKNIKIFYLRPFAAICDQFEAPCNQKGIKKLKSIKVQDPRYRQDKGL